MIANGSGGFNAPYDTGFGAGTYYQRAVSADLDSDGKRDVLVPDQSGPNWYWLHQNAAGTWQYTNTGVLVEGAAGDAWFMDADGDAREDLVWKSSSTQIRWRRQTAPLTFAASAIGITYSEGLATASGLTFRQLVRLGDFNGDGRRDLFVPLQTADSRPAYGSSGTAVGFIAGYGFYGPYQLNTATLNDDRYTDMYLYNTDTNTWHLLPSGGPTFYGTGYEAAVDTFRTSNFQETIAADWDADGHTDLLSRNASTGNWDYLRSTGGSLTAAASTGIPATGATLSPKVMDINGDGLPDLVYVNSGGSLFYRLHNGPKQDLIASITDGFGMSASFDIKSIASSSGCYTRESSAPTPAFPSRIFMDALYVVCGVTASNGIGGTYALSYLYSNADLHLQGRGFLGFGKRRVTDSRNGMTVFEEYAQAADDYERIGSLTKETVRQSLSGNVIRETINTWTRHSYESGFSEARYPYVSQRVVKDYGVGGGTSDGALLTTATTTNTVSSSSGAITDTTTTVTEAPSANGLNASSSHTLRTWHSALFDDFPNWCFGRPSTTQQINTHGLPGGAQVTRTSNRTWDGAYCRPTQEVIEPGNTQWQVTTDYGYDTFGNVNAMTVTPASGQGQSARTTSIDWGATTGRLPLSMINPKSQTTYFGWDVSRGLRTSITHPNGLVDSTQYDGFGRVIRQQKPDGTATDFAFGACTAGNSYCGQPDLRWYVQITPRNTGNAAIRTDWQYFNGFDRIRYDYQQTTTGSDSGIITLYDALGRIASRSTPFTPSDPAWYTTYSYDLLNRPTQIQRQASESDTSTSLTTIAYPGLRKITTDPLSHATTEIYNSLGQVVQAIDAAGSDTDYEYDAFGNLLKTRDVSGNEIVLTYNVRGMKLTSSDPDMGAWSYNYFPLGELKWQRDAKLQETNFTYDALSRPLTRVETEGTTSFFWDTEANGIGQLDYVTYGTNYTESYAYDTVGRRSQLSVTTDSISYVYDYAYQGTTGLLDTLTYPASTGGERFKVRYGYQYGHMASVQSYINNVVGTTYWQALATNARNQTTFEQFGNGLQSSSGYDRITGYLDDRVTGPSANGTIQNLTFGWNKVGSVSQRRDLNQNLTENFYYDNLDRLDYSTLNGSTNLDLAYNAIGNITSKSDVGTFAYHATKKHAVISTAGTVNNTYGYDANGNMTSRNGQTTTWSSYNYPLEIRQSSTVRTVFGYTHDRRMRKQTIYTNGNIETWWHIGGLFEKRTRTSTEYRHIIVGGDGPVAIRLRDGNGATTYYLANDHLGSTNTITSSTGASLLNASYDAFGKRRGSNWTGAPSSADLTQISNSTKHGFTFHEHLANLTLIHMQGRVFDPVIGRFMSADPYVQAPFNSQSLNRYSYVFNNPLSYTDPTGFCGWQEEPDCVEDSNPAWNTEGILMGAWFSMRNKMQAIVHRGLVQEPWEGDGTAPVDVAGSTVGGNGTWGDFFGGLLRGVVDDWHQMGAAYGYSRMIQAGQWEAADQLLVGANTPLLGPVDTPRGEFGYDLSGAAQIVVGGAGGALARRGRTAAEAAYHYTFGRFVSSIERQGLRAGSYATPNGALSPLQAHIDLALRPNRGLPDTILRIDLEGLRRAGYQIPGVTRAGRSFGMPGGGYEMQFPYPIPPEFIKVISP